MRNYLVIALFWVGTIIGAYFYGSSKPIPPPEVREVIKVDRQVETVTQIVKLPSGEERTTIVEKEVEKTVVKREEIPVKQLWHISVSKSLKENIYSFGVEKKVLGDLSVGLYGTTDKNFGVTLGYSF